MPNSPSHDVPRKIYLGDGAYAELTDQEVILTTENGIKTTNTIVLGSDEVMALIQFLKAHGVHITYGH